jgi:hypothetical protein
LIGFEAVLLLLQLEQLFTVCHDLDVSVFLFNAISLNTAELS